MTRVHAYPEGHWSLKVPIPYSMGVRHGETIVLSGQVDMSGNGIVEHPGDLDAQTEASIGHVRRILGELGAELGDLVKLVVFYRTNGSLDEDAYAARIGGLMENARPTVTFVPLPALAYPGMMVEIDAYAMRGVERPLAREVATPADLPPLAPPFVHGLRCGEMICVSGQKARDASGQACAPGDVVAQSRIALDGVARVFAALGADMDDAVKMNAFYVGEGTAAVWEEGARVRAGYFREPGPVATGIPMHAMWPHGAVVCFDLWAMRGEDGRRLPREHVWPEGHWDWPIHLPYKHGLRCRDKIFVGGQVSLDTRGRVVDAGDMAAQTRRAMENVGRVLAGFGAGFEDVVKQNCFYVGSDDPEHLHANVNVRSSFYRKPGPASTGVPLDHLAYRDMLVEIEAMAIRNAEPAR